MKLFLSAVGAVLLAGCGIPESSAIAQAQATSSGGEPVVESAVAPPTNSVTAVPVVAPAPTPELPPNLPEAARQIVKLAHGRLGDGVVTNFIANIDEPFHLDADQIVYLRDLGLSPAILETLLAKEQELADQEPKKPATPVVAVTVAPPAASSGPANYPGGKPELAPPQVGPAVTSTAPPSSDPPPAGPTEVNYNFFYDSLAPYGNWLTVPTYGYVWQPSCAVVSPGWRPYWNDGCWNWCDAGWYWNSSYSWGWAPFHYGNWVNAPGSGWCWVPGRTWAPSWVTFRYGGGYCGWAPLPPGCGVSAGVGLTWAGSGVSFGFGFGYSATDYCWTPTSYFTASNCSAYGVYGSGVHQIYNGSSVVNNYVVGNNNTIINNGIDPNHISPHSRTEVRKMQLTDANSPGAAGVGAGLRGRPGDPTQLAVYRPQVGAVPSASGNASVRREVRPAQFASTGVGSGSASTAGNSLARRPMAQQPDWMPAPNPRTPAVALHGGAGSTLGGRSGELRAPSGTSSGSISRPGGTRVPNVSNGQALVSRGGSPYGANTGGSVGNGRLEPRKAPVVGETMPGAATPPGSVGGLRPGSSARVGGSSAPSGYGMAPGNSQGISARSNPRPVTPAPMPSMQRMQVPASQMNMSRPMPMPSQNFAPRGGVGGGGGGAGAGGGAILRPRP